MRHLVRASVRVYERTSIPLHKVVGAQFVMKTLGRTGIGCTSLKHDTVRTSITVRIYSTV